MVTLLVMNLVITSKGPETLCWPASTGSQQETWTRVRCYCYSLFHPSIAFFACMLIYPPKTSFTFHSVSFLSRSVQNDFKGTKAVTSPVLWAKSQDEWRGGWGRSPEKSASREVSPDASLGAWQQGCHQRASQ